MAPLKCPSARRNVTFGSDLLLATLASANTRTSACMPTAGNPVSLIPLSAWESDPLALVCNVTLGAFDRGTYYLITRVAFADAFVDDEPAGSNGSIADELIASAGVLPAVPGRGYRRIPGDLTGLGYTVAPPTA